MARQHPFASAIFGLRDALPIVLAYFPIAVTYGVLARSSGLSFEVVLLISVLIYAGASQFILISLYLAGAGPASLLFTVLLVNMRHILYGATLSTVFRHWREPAKWIAAFGLTDEVFAVSTGRHVDHPGPAYQFALAFASYASWVAGTSVGATVGNGVPTTISTILTFALPALFLALLSQHRGMAQLGAAVVGAGIAVGLQSSGATGLGIVAGSVLGASVGMILAARAPNLH